MNRTVFPVLAQLRQMADPIAKMPDRVLLDRFCAGDGDAFAQLVSRYGPMVLGVCRRVLGEAEADDAFQATFLTLARRARTLAHTEALAAWLHTVSRNTALKARRSELRRRRYETTRQIPTRAPATADEVTARELLAVLDEEVDRLPDVFRLPLLLCYWQGLTQDEAAARLGWSAGSIKGRLERGRRRLADRMARRGFAIQSLLLVSLASTAVPADLLAAG